MNHSLHCKFCKKPITVEIDDTYTGDPLKLIQKASCNLCADLRVEKRQIYERLNHVIHWLTVSGESDKVRDNIRESLTILTKRLMRLIARWMGTPDLEWSEEIVDQMMDNPSKAYIVLSHMWTAGRERQKQLL